MPAGEERAAVDVGPLTGYVSVDEMDAETARDLMADEVNTPYPVVVQSIDLDRVEAIVSREQFEEHWRELADGISEGVEVVGVLQSLSDGVALFDLGSGLLGRMPYAPRPGQLSVLRRDALGETFPLRVAEIDFERHYIAVEHRDQEIEDLIGQGESQELEFKASPRRSPRTGENDPGATFGVVKGIAGFLNSYTGGTLLVGIDDGKLPIEDERGNIGVLAIDGYADEDEMRLALRGFINNRLGLSFYQFLNTNFVDYRATRILRIDCGPSDKEVWMTGGKSGKSKEEQFFLRTPAATDPVEGRKLADYIRERFPQSLTDDKAPAGC